MAQLSSLARQAELGLPTAPRLDGRKSLDCILNVLPNKPEIEMAMIYGTIVKAHRHKQDLKGDGHRQVEGRLDDQSSP
ncbi:MAG: hypothetical protein Q4G24_14695 [Paracoccus sp. (in: a-proteobacteria)]|uniref:hypothetical protein n=1 Tax=Paracoccus sp. TaxID=267 RepID=UPI0026DED7E7|nr:hypothetical protein [Paracoccus sp. (in: a-proteobacteria)]MDO5622705.1 hypothetical protein [Paracoccus sp. (in: a-proteobacteria)]